MKYKIFANTIEPGVVSQVERLMKSPLSKNSHLRIMPDCHVGKGCVIGTSMIITDKVCPNLVGVDIACGVTLMHTNIDFKSNLEALDEIIKKNIPAGREIHEKDKRFEKLTELKCFDKFTPNIRKKAMRSLGTLGGGNHFIEAYEDGYVCVHSGSRNIGKCVAEYYQELAIKKIKDELFDCELKKTKFFGKTLNELTNIEKGEYFDKIKEIKKSLVLDEDSSLLAFLSGTDMQDYIHDSLILNEFARASRTLMLNVIRESLNGSVDYEIINSTHNFIEIGKNKLILRKGATPAYKGQSVLIPLNMHDGLLICEGLGNKDWNYTAPHGAGRLYSRHSALQKFSLDEYKKSMEGIYSTCINEETLDEAPFVYKNYEEIMELIKPTVKIIKRLIPIYNFKASEDNDFRRNKETPKDNI
jgi:RNA-splicing ligase RtcB